MRGIFLIALLVVSNLTTFYVTKKNMRPKPWERDPSASLARIAQAQGPSILVIGDSLTAGAILPEQICGHKVINAGKSGARASTFIPFAEDLRAVRLKPDLIVIALGINDAMTNYETDFRTAFRMLVASLPAAPLAIATLAPIGNGAPLNKVVMASVEKTILEVAESRHATIIDLSSIKGFETVDGLHPTENSKIKWIDTMDRGIKRALECR
jgi:lysophospholipase L1-like esterase